jgi:hypothetical protein
VLCPEREGIHGDDGEDQAEERAGQPGAEPLRGHDDREHAERDAERAEVDVVEPAEEIADPIDGGGPSTGNTEDDGGCRAMMPTAIPGRTPVMTGVESSSEIHPRRTRPTPIRIAPTRIAVKAIAEP